MSRTELWLDECRQRRADHGSRTSRKEGFAEVRREGAMKFENTNRTKQELKKGAQMRISISLVGVIVGGLLLAPVPGQAHHAFPGAFDGNRPPHFPGKVKRV